METIKHLYKFKRATSQRWAEVNPILFAGEPAFETDTHKLKIGDGFSPYLSLPYIGSNIRTYPTFLDLPTTGDSETLYIVIKDSLIYTWNEDSYLALSGAGGSENIKLINGGTSKWPN